MTIPIATKLAPRAALPFAIATTRCTSPICHSVVRVKGWHTVPIDGRWVTLWVFGLCESLCLQEVIVRQTATCVTFQYTCTVVWENDDDYFVN